MYKTLIIVIGLVVFEGLFVKTGFACTDFPLLGVYRIYGNAPQEFASFKEMSLTFKKSDDYDHIKPNSEGKILLRGWIRSSDDKLLKFKEIYLQSDKKCFNQIHFKSVALNGIFFEFDGYYYEKAQFRGAGYVQLKGVLKIVKNGKASELNGEFEKWGSSDFIAN